MMIIWILAIVFIILLFLPILVGILYYKRNEGQVLFIRQDKVQDGRYFGKSFSSLIRQGLQNIEGNIITLSKKEEFINGDQENIDSDHIDKLVISREKEFVAERGQTFIKEIYGQENISIKDNVKLRAVYSDKNMIIGKGADIMRWADAGGTLAVYDDCNLGISVSSGSRISVGQNCHFQRLYASEIYLGQYPGEILDPTEGKDPRIYRLPVQAARKEKIRYISNEMVNKEGIVDFSVLSRENVSVTENIIVKGDIRSSKGVRLFNGAIVVGNIFAEKDIILGENSCVLGNVFSQENVYMERGAVVGKKGTISSLIARETITLEPETFVFGYISCERGGSVLSSPNKEEKRTYNYLEGKETEEVLVFKDLKDFEGVDQQGYRFREDIEIVIIPDGAKKIQKSMFFNCSSLKKVYIPGSIEEIGDFAFADCQELVEISLKGKKHLRKIGISAFENCKSIKKVEIPQAVEVLEAATFAGCTSLSSISFAEDAKLKTIKDHCFRGCISLKELRFTSYIGKLSDSAFKDCKNLKDVTFVRKTIV